MTYYQLIRRCLLAEAAGMTALGETIMSALRRARKKEAENNARSEKTDPKSGLR